MNINIVTVDDFFGQSLPTEKSVDLMRLKKNLSSKGYSIKFLDVQELQAIDINNDDIYLFGSHQNPDVKKYIDDTVNSCFSDNSHIIPSKINILAHDNKGIQAVLARKIGAEYFPAQSYFYRPMELNQPSVVKKISGAGSSGVELVNTKNELSKALRQFSYQDINIGNVSFYLKAMLKKYIFRKKYSDAFVHYNKKYTNYALQEFYPGLKNDYKLLVFGETVYVLKRGVRQGGFKASGSGKFSYPSPESSLLEFGLTLRKLINTPYVSLDIVELGKDNYKCIEFQCVHFGPYTQINSEFKYIKMNNSEWHKVESSTDLEYEMAQALDHYIINTMKFPNCIC